MSDNTREAAGIPRQSSTSASPTPANSLPTPSTPPAGYILSQLLREYEVHILSGPSGSGRTTLLLQLYLAVRDRTDFLSYASRTVSTALCLADRSAASLRDTSERLGISYPTLPVISLVSDLRNRSDDPIPPDDRTLEEVISITRRKIPDCELLLIDGLADLCPGNISVHRDVTDFLKRASWLCQQHRITILGTTPTPKSQSSTDGKYSWILDRTLGAGAWSTHTSTKIFIEPEDEKRVVTCIPKNFPARVFDLMHRDPDGVLVPFVESTCRELDAWLGKLDPETLITTQQILLVAGQHDISRATTFRWIKFQLSLGSMHKVDRGEYRVSKTATQN